MKTPYPPWICLECGRQHGRIIEGHIATFHEPEAGEKCGWCASTKLPLTEPRDYGYPPRP